MKVRKRKECSPRSSPWWRSWLAVVAGVTGSASAADQGADRDRLGRTTARATWRPSTIRRSLRQGRTSRTSTPRSMRGGGVPLQDRHLRHAGQQAGDVAKGVRRSSLLGQGVEHHLHHLRRRLRDAGRAGGDQRRGKLTIAPCIGTDQMGPKRFGSKGDLACVQLRQRRAGRGLGHGAVGLGRRAGRRPARATNTACIAYFKVVVQAFEARFKQLEAGGKIVDHETYQSTGANERCRRRSAELNGKKADVYRDGLDGSSFGAAFAFVDGPARARQPDSRCASTRGPATAPTGCTKEPAGHELLRRRRSPRRSATTRTPTSTRSRSRLGRSRPTCSAAS